MKKTILFLLIAAGSIFPQSNLDYFLNSALKNNPALKEYENSKRISALDIKLIDAENVMPKISMTANYQYFPYFNNGGRYVTTNPGPDAIGYDIGITNGGFYSAQLNFEKNLFNGELIDALQNQNAVTEKTISNNIIVEKHNITRAITDQYLATLRSQLINKLNDEILQNIKEQILVAKNLVEKGFAKQSDYLLLKLEEGNRKIDCGNSYVEFKNNLYSLYSTCGIKDTQTIELENISLVLVRTNDVSFFLQKYETDSLALAAQQGVSETKYLPQLKVFFNTGLNAVELQGIQKKFGLSAGLDFSFPIYDGGQKDITRQQNIIGLNTIRNYKEYFSAELQNKRKTADEQLKFTKQNIEQIKGQVEDYRSIMNMKKNELENGQISMVEYLTILGNYVNLKKNLITAQIDYQTQINNYNYWNW
jgi:outer membrane protein TolC